MLEIIITVYALWFLLLYILSLSIFFRRTTITKNMINLTGLNLKPVADKEKNTISVNNNFDDFAKKHSDVIENNFVMRILCRMCADAKIGKK